MKIMKINSGFCACGGTGLRPECGSVPLRGECSKMFQRTHTIALLAALICAAPALAQQAGDLSPLAADQWNADRAAHLLERAGFGGTPEEIARLAQPFTQLGQNFVPVTCADFDDNAIAAPFDANRTRAERWLLGLLNRALKNRPRDRRSPPMRSWITGAEYTRLSSTMASRRLTFAVVICSNRRAPAGFKISSTEAPWSCSAGRASAPARG